MIEAIAVLGLGITLTWFLVSRFIKGEEKTILPLRRQFIRPSGKALRGEVTVDVRSDDKGDVYIPKYVDEASRETLCFSNEFNKYNLKDTDYISGHIVAFRTLEEAKEFAKDHNEGDLI